jgi:membrane protein YdbS with pleckstrin-like domain
MMQSPAPLHPQPRSERRISEMAFLGSYALAAVIGVVIAIICFAVKQGGWSPLGLLPLAWTFAQSRLARMSTVYRLFPDRVEVHSGLMSRKIENVQLFRVHDVSLRQGLLGRIFGYGDVALLGSDASAPTLVLKGIDHPDHVYQELRGMIQQARLGGQTMYLE